jgi:hypothetical protein
MKSFILVVLTLAVGISISSCKKHSDAPSTSASSSSSGTPRPPASVGPYLYVGALYPTGIYWKISLSEPNSKPIYDTLANAGGITSIVTSGRDVYVAGQRGGYWKNDTLIPVTGASGISYITLLGSTVYAAGWGTYGNSAYWIGNTEINTENTFGRSVFPYEGTSELSLSGIVASASNTFVSGSLWFENEPFSPDSAAQGSFGLLWNNGSLQLFGSGGSASFLSAVNVVTVGVAVSGTDVYVAGRYPDTTFAGGFWKNGVWNPIAKGTFVPNSIVTIGGTVYMPGSYYNRTSITQQAAVWANGVLTNLGGASATSVAVYGSDVYILGMDNNGNNVIWKNGAVFDTLGPANTMSATVLAIGQ